MNLNIDTAKKLDFKHIGMPTLAWCKDINVVYDQHWENDSLVLMFSWIGERESMREFAKKLATYFSENLSEQDNNVCFVIYYEMNSIAMVSVTNINLDQEEDESITLSIAENILNGMSVFDILQIQDYEFVTSTKNVPENYKQLINHLKTYDYLSSTASF